MNKLNVGPKVNDSHSELIKEKNSIIIAIIIIAILIIVIIIITIIELIL